MRDVDDAETFVRGVYREMSITLAGDYQGPGQITGGMSAEDFDAFSPLNKVLMARLANQSIEMANDLMESWHGRFVRYDPWVGMAIKESMEVKREIRDEELRFRAMMGRNRDKTRHERCNYVSRRECPDHHRCPFLHYGA